jgi:hypothetical protein
MIQAIGIIEVARTTAPTATPGSDARQRRASTARRRRRTGGWRTSRADCVSNSRAGVGAAVCAAGVTGIRPACRRIALRRTMAELPCRGPVQRQVAVAVQSVAATGSGTQSVSKDGGATMDFALSAAAAAASLPGRPRRWRRSAAAAGGFRVPLFRVPRFASGPRVAKASSGASALARPPTAALTADALTAGALTTVRGAAAGRGRAQRFLSLDSRPEAARR